MFNLYHGVPEDMRGTEIVPLSEMMHVDGRLGAKYLAKYDGRESVIERKIPLLDCSWRDVVELLPLPPQKLFEYQKSLGLIDDLPDYRYFQIDPDSLDMSRAVVFFKTAPGDENTGVKWLADVDLAELQDIPEATKKYYESLVGKGEPVFNYQFVPHILYRGTIDVSTAEIISLF